MQRAWILNVSRGGVGLLLSRPLEAGQAILLRLTRTADGQVVELPAHVAHATQEPGGEWVVGCRLDNELTSEQLDALL
jgi:hypothetical protein